MDVKRTSRGFSLIEFTDRNGEKCSLQKSSIATEDCIWLGSDEDPKKHLGQWLGSRMHLSQAQVKELLVPLKFFAKTGRLPTRIKPTP